MAAARSRATGASARGYGAGARVLAVGIASTGLFTFAYFAVADQVLGDTEYGAISLLWSVLFVALSVLYRPVEQLLSRTIAARRARGAAGGHPLRTAVVLQSAFAAASLALAFAFRQPLEDAFGSSTLFWVFVGAAVAYAASYFARGYFAGHGWFGLYGGLVLFESVGRFCFPLAVAVGVASGQAAVALGILAAPLLSLLVVPLAIARHARGRAADDGPPAGTDETLRTAGGFAIGVGLVQLAEQTLLNAAVLTVAATATTALAGVVFNALLIVRAPLQLFQAVQTSLLPHLAGAAAGDDRAAFRGALRTTVLAIAGFAGAVALGLLAVGPWVMELVFAKSYDYGRVGLAAIGAGMGFHLVAGTLNQALLARGRARRAAACWLTAAAAFVAWMLFAPVDDQLVRTELGYLGAATLVCALAALAVRRG